jgi:hypothetical protein
MLLREAKLSVYNVMVVHMPTTLGCQLVMSHNQVSSQPNKEILEQCRLLCVKLGRTAPPLPRQCVFLVFLDGILIKKEMKSVYNVKPVHIRVYSRLLNV